MGSGQNGCGQGYLRHLNLPLPPEQIELGGRFITIHIGGLGRESAFDLCWQKTLAGLTELVHRANKLGLRLCIENLAWGWTSRPDLFEKLIRLSGAWATLDDSPKFFERWPRDILPGPQVPKPIFDRRGQDCGIISV